MESQRLEGIQTSQIGSSATRIVHTRETEPMVIGIETASNGEETICIVRKRKKSEDSQSDQCIYIAEDEQQQDLTHEQDIIIVETMQVGPTPTWRIPTGSSLGQHNSDGTSWTAKAKLQAGDTIAVMVPEYNLTTGGNFLCFTEKGSRIVSLLVPPGNTEELA